MPWWRGWWRGGERVGGGGGERVGGEGGERVGGGICGGTVEGVTF